MATYTVDGCGCGCGGCPGTLCGVPVACASFAGVGADPALTWYFPAIRLDFDAGSCSYLGYSPAQTPGLPDLNVSLQVGTGEHAGQVRLSAAWYVYYPGRPVGYETAYGPWQAGPATPCASLDLSADLAGAAANPWEPAQPLYSSAVVRVVSGPCPGSAPASSGGGTGVQSFASAAPEASPAERPRCRHLGAKLKPAAAARLGLGTVRTYSRCAKGYGTRGADGKGYVACCLPSPAGCADCPEFVRAGRRA